MTIWRYLISWILVLSSSGFDISQAFNIFPTPAVQTCHGTCQLSLTCWISGGTVQGACGGLVYVCCQQSSESSSRDAQVYAQPRKLDIWDELETNNIEILQPIHYGPVRNDPMCGMQR